MTIEIIKAHVESIKKYSYDDERAHDLEDMLYRQVLTYIATKKPDFITASEMAKEALRTRNIDFARWRA